MYVDPDGHAGTGIVGTKKRWDWMSEEISQWFPFGRVLVRDGENDVFFKGFLIGVNICFLLILF
jgi:hypothetical protein